MSNDSSYSQVSECKHDKFIHHFGRIASALPIGNYGIPNLNCSCFSWRTEKSSGSNERSIRIKFLAQNSIPPIPSNNFISTLKHTFKKEFLGRFIIFSRWPIIGNSAMEKRR